MSAVPDAARSSDPMPCNARPIGPRRRAPLGARRPARRPVGATRTGTVAPRAARRRQAARRPPPRSGEPAPASASRSSPYISLYLAISRYISLYLPISPCARCRMEYVASFLAPYISLYLPISRYISLYLPAPGAGWSTWPPHISPYLPGQVRHELGTKGLPSVAHELKIRDLSGGQKVQGDIARYSEI